MRSESPPKYIPYSDEDITFFIQTHNEGEYTFRAASRIRELYQNSRIIVRSDGISKCQFDWATIGVNYYNEQVLFRVEHGGAAIQRMMEIFLSKSPSNFLVKIDPDTLFHRRLSFLPESDGLFGTVQELDGCFSIQGGFIGLSKYAAQKIYDSQLMLRPELRNPDPNEGGYMAILYRRSQRVGLPSYDWSLGWAATRLGIDFFDFSEVCCTWKQPSENPHAKFAVTHPDPARPIL